MFHGRPLLHTLEQSHPVNGVKLWPLGEGTWTNLAQETDTVEFQESVLVSDDLWW